MNYDKLNFLEKYALPDDHYSFEDHPLEYMEHSKKVDKNLLLKHIEKSPYGYNMYHRILEHKLADSDVFNKALDHHEHDGTMDDMMVNMIPNIPEDIQHRLYDSSVDRRSYQKYRIVRDTDSQSILEKSSNDPDKGHVFTLIGNKHTNTNSLHKILSNVGKDDGYSPYVKERLYKEIKKHKNADDSVKSIVDKHLSELNK